MRRSIRRQMAAGETFIVLGAHKNAVQTDAMKIQFECDRNIHCQHEMRKKEQQRLHKSTSTLEYELTTGNTFFRSRHINCSGHTLDLHWHHWLHPFWILILIHGDYYQL